MESELSLYAKELTLRKELQVPWPWELKYRLQGKIFFLFSMYRLSAYICTINDLI